MTSMQVSKATTTQQPGRLSRAVLALFTKPATVAAVCPIDERFRLITLQSPAFQGCHWVAGQKVQIMLNSTLVARTFTPIEWDGAAGSTRFLAYAHGRSPGSDWSRSVKVGEACHVFGPRASIEVGEVAGPVVVLGDETSIGLVYSILHQSPARTVCCLLEVSAVENTRAVLARLAIGSAEVFERREDGSHLHAIEQRLVGLAGMSANFVLTGNAQSIQRLRRGLKQLGVPARRMVSKAYWAQGKTGLD